MAHVHLVVTNYKNKINYLKLKQNGGACPLYIHVFRQDVEELKTKFLPKCAT